MPLLLHHWQLCSCNKHLPSDCEEIFAIWQNTASWASDCLNTWLSSIPALLWPISLKWDGSARFCNTRSKDIPFQVTSDRPFTNFDRSMKWKTKTRTRYYPIGKHVSVSNVYLHKERYRRWFWWNRSYSLLLSFGKPCIDLFDVCMIRKHVQTVAFPIW